MPKSEAGSIFTPSTEPLSLTVLLFPGASMMCVASTVDPLRAANRIAGHTVFDWRLVSTDGIPPNTTAGLPVPVSGRFDPAARTDVLIAVGGFGTRYETASGIVAAFRRMARGALCVIGVEAGTWLLARAGLLDGRKATTHWEDMEDFTATFPAVDVLPDRYVIDGPCVTIGGAAPTIDLMLHLIRTRLGAAVALDVASVFIYDQARAASDAQPLVSLGRLEAYDPRVARAIRLMEAHVDAPLTTAAIATRIGVSARTLETVFSRSIGETPGSYSLRLRLNAARRLVLDTAEPMTNIAARTGFSSAAAFSRAFARGFGTPPSRMRNEV